MKAALMLIQLIVVLATIAQLYLIVIIFLGNCTPQINNEKYQQQVVGTRYKVFPTAECSDTNIKKERQGRRKVLADLNVDIDKASFKILKNTTFACFLRSEMYSKGLLVNINVNPADTGVPQ